MPDAHHAFDVGHGRRLADAVAWQERNLNRQEHLVAEAAHRFEAEDALISRIRNDHEVVLPQIEPAGRRPFVEDAHNLEPLGPDAHGLPDRVESPRGEQHLVRRVAEDDDVLPVLHLRAVEEAAAEDGDARPLREVFRRAEQDNRLRLDIAVKHALLVRLRTAGAQLDVDQLNRRPLVLERAGIGDGQIRALEQIRDFRAVGEAGDAEALDEDRVRPDLADQLAERLIEAANERRHADDRRDADDDAEDRQSGAQLVAAHGLERHRNDFGQEG